jgi:hypothetical protein
LVGFGIGGILGQEMDDLKSIEGVTDSTVLKTKVFYPYYNKIKIFVALKNILGTL